MFHHGACLTSMYAIYKLGSPLAIGKIQVTVEMIKAARELLRWRQEELASRAGIAISTLRRLEGMTGPVGGSEETKARITSALRGAGIEFSEGGVCLK
jgi:DNA-binding XRE family transcriptional regulator